MSEDRTHDDTGAEPTQPDWSQFSRRLAGFGLGEAPNPLLTRVPPPAKPSRHSDRHSKSSPS